MASAEAQRALAQLLHEIKAKDQDSFINLRNLHASSSAAQPFSRNAAVHPSGSNGPQLEEGILRLLNEKRSPSTTFTPRPSTGLASLARSHSARASSNKKPNIVTSVLSSLFGGTEPVRSRTWEAKSAQVLELEMQQRELERQKLRDQEEVRMLENVVESARMAADRKAVNLEVASRRQTTAERQEKLKKAMDELRLRKAGLKKQHVEEISLEEQEREALADLEATKLLVQKLRLARKEQTQKELIEMQEKLRKLGLGARIVADSLYTPYEDPLYPSLDYLGAREPHSLPDSYLLLNSRTLPLRSATWDGLTRQRDDLFGDSLDQPFGIENGFFYDEQSDPYNELRQRHRRGLGVDDPLFGGAVHDDLFADDNIDPFLRQGARGLPGSLDTRAILHRRVPAGLASVPHLDPDDPKLDPNSRFYDRRYAKMFKVQQEKEARVLIAERQQQERLRAEQIARKRAIEEKDKELEQLRHYLLIRQQHYEDEIQKAETEKQKAMLQVEIEEVARHEARLAQEEDLHRLEKLLLDHPESAINGLDYEMMKDNPRLLEEALKHVERNIATGKPLMVSEQERQVVAQRERALRERQLAEERERNKFNVDAQYKGLLYDFLVETEANQRAYLSQVAKEERSNFLALAHHYAPPATASILGDRFGLNTKGYPISPEITTNLKGRSQLNTPDGPSQSRQHVLEDVPIIVVNSPPPTQDIDPILVSPAASAFVQDSTEVPNSAITTAFDQTLPTSHYTRTEGRNAPGHPSSQGGMSQEEIQLLEEEADIERESYAIQALEDEHCLDKEERLQDQQLSTLEQQKEVFLHSDSADEEVQHLAQSSEANIGRQDPSPPMQMPTPPTWNSSLPDNADVAKSIVLFPVSPVPMPDMAELPTPPAFSATGNVPETQNGARTSATRTSPKPTSEALSPFAEHSSQFVSLSKLNSPEGSPASTGLAIHPSSSIWAPGTSATPTPSVFSNGRSVTGLEGKVVSRPDSRKSSKPPSVKTSYPSPSTYESKGRDPKPASKPSSPLFEQNISSQVTDSTVTHGERHSVSPGEVSMTGRSVRSISHSHASMIASPVLVAATRVFEVVSPAIASGQQLVTPPPPITPATAITADTIAQYKPAEAISTEKDQLVKSVKSSPAHSEPAVKQTIQTSPNAFSPLRSSIHARSPRKVASRASPSPALKDSPRSGPEPFAPKSPLVAVSSTPINISISRALPSPPVAGAWGEVSPDVKDVKPVSPVAKNGGAIKARSPLFGVESPGRVSGSGSHQNIGDMAIKNAKADRQELATTAHKGSDPVVVSLAADEYTPPVARPSYVQEAVEEQDNCVEGSLHMAPEELQEVFDTFPVFMQGESLEEGWEPLQEPSPRPFREVFAKDTPDVTQENILNRIIHIAHQYGFDAILECYLQESAEEIMIQGYFVYLDRHPQLGGLEAERREKPWGQTAENVEDISKATKVTEELEEAEDPWK